MGNCNNCNNCNENGGVTLFATNVLYQTKLPDWSRLKDEKCVYIEETTDELYGEITKLRSNIKKSELCKEIKYVEGADGFISYREIAVKHSVEICNLISMFSSKYEESLSVDLDCIDWKKLKKLDNCGNEIKPKNLCEAFQIIVDKVNELIP